LIEIGNGRSSPWLFFGSPRKEWIRLKHSTELHCLSKAHDEYTIKQEGYTLHFHYVKEEPKLPSEKSDRPGLAVENTQMQTESVVRIGKLALDLFPIRPIIGRNTCSRMNTLFVLSLIVIVIAVLIIKDLVSVRMATVRVKK
jgi:hypothetical protein